MDFTTSIVNWFKDNRRALPWRETKDPYAIWLSEVILQQTRIAQGRAYWEKFITTWPTYESLAGASEDEVLKAWQGLGYYSRARNLHAAAQQLVALGGFPITYKAIRQLKGVGDYTAAAIASIAFGEPVAVVDGNVYRVLSRYFGIDTPIDTTQGKKEFAALAQELLYTQDPSGYNQAIMDFGAILCTPANPLCHQCPLIDTCRAYQQQTIALLPVKAKKIKQTERHFHYVCILHEDEIAIHQRGGGDIWQGLWELPDLATIKALNTNAFLGHAKSTNDQTTPKQPYSDARKHNEKGEEATTMAPFPEDFTEICRDIKHVLTHQIIHADLYLWIVSHRPSLPEDYIWIKTDKLSHYAIPRLMEILLEKARPFLPDNRH